ncbi:hypothetical protein Sjap_021741 [Stephania japonica]|uniref:Pentatricopeptide repeat-containing protein n=1 Tax=Stephania japonica TaxID=461633 RepID=A0AAP0EMY3_9MAGN
MTESQSMSFSKQGSESRGSRFGVVHDAASRSGLHSVEASSTGGPNVVGWYASKLTKLVLAMLNYFKPFSNKFATLSNNIISLYSDLISHSLHINNSNLTKIIHAQLIKTGIYGRTFLGNRLLDAFCRFGDIGNAQKLFDEMPERNCYTWNVMLIGLFKCGCVERGRHLFDEMPQPDVVSWNSMISGYCSNGFIGYGLEVFRRMVSVGVMPSAFTYSILMSCVSFGVQAKEIHGCVIRSGLGLSNVVLGNYFVKVYGELKLLEYAFGVFRNMDEVDVISWNSLILGCDKSGYGDLGLVQFGLMRFGGYSPDHFTMSTVLAICCSLQALEKGKQVFSLSVVMGFISNSIVSSAIIDMFSKCGRLDESVKLFKEMHRWDSAICNSMISGYSWHGFHLTAIQLFMSTLRNDLSPTEFTLSNVLSSTSCFLPSELGIQIHSMVLKMGFKSYAVVATSLVDMYCKSGLIDSAFKIFGKMDTRDLVSWNSIIMGFARYGSSIEAMELFEQLGKEGPLPDKITFTGVLLACCHGGLFVEGMNIFSSMEKRYGVIPSMEHYTCVVSMMCQSGNLSKALDIIETMPQKPDFMIWRLLIYASQTYGMRAAIARYALWKRDLNTISSLVYLLKHMDISQRCRTTHLVRIIKAELTNLRFSDSCSFLVTGDSFVVEKANNTRLLGSTPHIESLVKTLTQKMVRNKTFLYYDVLSIVFAKDYTTEQMQWSSPIWLEMPTMR